jgi:hypothetical protein
LWPQELEQEPQRDYEGNYVPYEQQVQPMQEDFIGGFHPGLQQPPPPPPKDRHSALRFPGLDTFSRSNTIDDSQAPRPWVPAYPAMPKSPSVSAPDMSNMSAVERSKLQKTARMHPHLQFMCGPLLRYDDITDQRSIWRGFVMIVSTCYSTPGGWYIDSLTHWYCDPQLPMRVRYMNPILVSLINMIPTLCLNISTALEKAI